MDMSLIDIGEAPTRRHPYFLEHDDELELPREVISSAIARPATSFVGALFLYVITLAQVIAAATMLVTSESIVSVIIAFVATLAGTALQIAMSMVLGEEIVYLVSNMLPSMFSQARHRWRRLRSILRQLAGGSVALS